MTTSGNAITIERRIGLRRHARGGERTAVAAPPEPIAPGRVPRLSRLLALALQMRRMVDEGSVRDYSELARLAGVTVARMTQIIQLLLLAPEIQEDVLFLPRIVEGRDPIHERRVRPITSIPSWRRQRVEWERLKRSIGSTNQSDQSEHQASA